MDGGFNEFVFGLHNMTCGGQSIGNLGFCASRINLISVRLPRRDVKMVNLGRNRRIMNHLGMHAEAVSSDCATRALTARSEL